MAEVEKTTVQAPEDPVAKAVAEKEAEWKAKWEAELTKAKNAAAKSEREAYEKKLRESTMTEAERLKAENEEAFKKLSEENAQLKSEKSRNIRENAVMKASIPTHYLNDVRLLNAKDEEVPEIIKVLQKEHNDFVKELTKGSVQATAPKTPQTAEQMSPEVERLAKKAPWLAGVGNTIKK